MSSLAIFSYNSLCSILDIVYEHTKNNKVDYILSHGSIWEMGVTTPGSRMHFTYIYIYIYIGQMFPTSSGSYHHLHFVCCM